MQWVVLTPLAILFCFVAVPALTTALRGAKLLRESGTPASTQLGPGRGWLIALGILALYFVAPFVVAPIVGVLAGD